jgi:hypothetical protein
VTSLRNAPCPCGSGRKQKHCCGRPPVVLEPSGAECRAAGERLEAFSRDKRFDAHVRRAIRLLFGD